MRSPNEPAARQRTNPADEPSKKRRIRPPRGLGLRSRAGCIPCRSRHRKCDEVRPFCGDCKKFNRDCQWAPPSQADAVPRVSVTDVGGLRRSETASPNRGDDSGMEDHSAPELSFGIERRFSVSTSTGALSFESPDSSRATLDGQTQSHWSDVLRNKPNEALAQQETPSEIESSIKASFPLIQWSIDEVAGMSGPGNADESLGRSQEFFMGRWENNDPAPEVNLSKTEIAYFSSFVKRCAGWFDIFDHQQHFASHVAHLARHDEGLMNAVLALAAHHLLHLQSIHQMVSTVSLDDAARFYSKALCYVQRAMQHASYAQSEELLATSLIVSAYEMMTESMEGWTRHLKGVYWIQRCQKVNSLSPGLRQAVWWSWLRQEQFAAFREKRKSLSYWEPPEPMANQTSDQLVGHITIILRHAINFAAPRDGGQLTSVQYLAGRMQIAEKILQDLAEWERCLDPLIRPQAFDASCIDPEISETVRDAFQPLWIYPHKFAVAKQMFYFARILVYMNRPILNGIGTDFDVRKALRESASGIGGIALALEDEAGQIISSQCLFGAGMCEYVDTRHNAILELITRCERRSGWPASQLKNDLQQHWMAAR